MKNLKLTQLQYSSNPYIARNQYLLVSQAILYANGDNKNLKEMLNKISIKTIKISEKV